MEEDFSIKSETHQHKIELSGRRRRKRKDSEAKRILFFYLVNPALSSGKVIFFSFLSCTRRYTRKLPEFNMIYSLMYANGLKEKITKQKMIFNSFRKHSPEHRKVFGIINEKLGETPLMLRWISRKSLSVEAFFLDFSRIFIQFFFDFFKFNQNRNVTELNNRKQRLDICGNGFFNLHSTCWRWPLSDIPKKSAVSESMEVVFSPLVPWAYRTNYFANLARSRYDFVAGLAVEAVDAMILLVTNLMNLRILQRSNWNVKKG